MVPEGWEGSFLSFIDRDFNGGGVVHGYGAVNSR